MTQQQEEELYRYLISPSFQLLEGMLNGVYSQVIQETLADKNIIPENWEYLADFLLGKRIGCSLIRNILLKLRIRPRRLRLAKNNAHKMAKYKGIAKVIEQFVVSIKSFVENYEKSKQNEGR